MNNLNLSGLKLSYEGQNVITPWDRLKKFIFQSYPVVTAPKIQTLDSLLEVASQYAGESPMIWMVAQDVGNIREDFPWHYRVDGIHTNYIHEFPRVIKRTGNPVAWGDVLLVPTSGQATGKIKNKITATYSKTDFDVVMISFHEAEADSNYQKLKEIYPDAIHVKNVEGIGAAHKQAAEQSSTQMVYIVDADADVLPDFKFDYIPPMSKRDNTTYVWSARNPINDLEYGYGGVKLFPRKQLLEMGHVLPDFSTGSAFYQPVSDISNITRFNKDPFRTWRSAFRECVKLASSVNPNQVKEETTSRLEAWCTIDNGGRFGRYCIKGALEGKAYGIANQGDVDALNKINDFEWLREQFVASMKKRISADD